MLQGFHSIPIEESSRDVCSFVCHLGQFRFRNLCFGITTGPGAYQQLINKVFHDLLHKMVWAYVDDIIVASSSVEEHFQHLQLVFDRLKEANLKMRSTKSQLFMSELEYLGYVITRSGLKPTPQKCEIISKFPQPLTKKEVRRFLGMASFYRKFIKDFSKLSGPLVKN